MRHAYCTAQMNCVSGNIRRRTTHSERPLGFLPDVQSVEFQILRRDRIIEMSVKKEELERLGKEVAQDLIAYIGNERIGFAFLLFDFDGEDEMVYFSNAKRPEMIEALKEMVAAIERNMQGESSETQSNG